MAVMIISSPDLILPLPKVCATKLMASVAPLTKIISFSLAALIKFLTLVRAPSNLSVERTLKV